MMTPAYEVAVGGGELDLYAAGLVPEQAALAHVLVGAYLGDLGRWQATRDLWPTTATRPVAFVKWAPTDHALASPPTTLLSLPIATDLGFRFLPHEAYDRQPP